MPSAHVYDKGYKKWENFDVESALKEVDDDRNNIYSNTGSIIDDGRSRLKEETRANKYESLPPPIVHERRTGRKETNSQPQK